MWETPWYFLSFLSTQTCIELSAWWCGLHGCCIYNIEYTNTRLKYTNKKNVYTLQMGRYKLLTQLTMYGQYRNSVLKFMTSRIYEQ